MNAGCAGKTEIPWECVPYPSAFKVCSRQGAVQIHVYLFLYLTKMNGLDFEVKGQGHGQTKYGQEALAQKMHLSR